MATAQKKDPETETTAAPAPETTKPDAPESPKPEDSKPETTDAPAPPADKETLADKSKQGTKQEPKLKPKTKQKHGPKFKKPAQNGRPYCHGLFCYMDASDFTQDERYSDTYLKSKGLFKDK